MGRSQRLFHKQKRNPPKRWVQHLLSEPDPQPSTSTAVVPEAVTPSSSRRSSVGSASTSSSVSSASQEKLGKNLEEYENFHSKASYDIIDIAQLSAALSVFAVCSACHGKVNMAVQSRIGLAAKIIFKCEECVEYKMFVNSTKASFEKDDGRRECFDINLRLVYGMRSIGKGSSGAATFCAVMNLPPPPTKVSGYEAVLRFAAQKVCEQSMYEAVVQSIDKSGGSKDLSVTFDGSWHKRGHTSLNGVITAISGETGKVIDCSILSKYCSCKERLLNKHATNCSANYGGSSGGMEVAGVREMYQRSVSKYDVRYLDYLGDGDSKAFDTMQREKPYGPEVTLKKSECVGHVQKRMGTRLRALKKKMGKQKLRDGKPIGGRGRLTDDVIDKIQTYYGLAVRRSSGTSVHEMRKQIWATFMHLLSTDKNPCHEFCDSGGVQWCKYKKAQREGTQYCHADHLHLPSVIMNEIKPIFKDLSESALLSRCLGGRTQNSNESFNHILWKFIPKSVFVTLPTLRLGTYEAISSFNSGNISKCRLFQILGVDPGENLVTYCEKDDIRRIREAAKGARYITQEARTKRRVARKKLEDDFADAEADDPSYGAGMH